MRKNEKRDLGARGGGATVFSQSEESGEHSSGLRFLSGACTPRASLHSSCPRTVAGPGPVSRSSPRSAEAPVCSILFSTWSFQDGRLQVQDRVGSMHVRKFRKTEKIDREQKEPGQEEQEWKRRQNGSSILCNVQPVSLVKHTLRQRLPDATNINSPLFLNNQTATLFRPLPEAGRQVS